MRVVSLVLAIAVSALLFSDNPRKDAPKGWREEPLVPGEKLTYSISWKGIYAGKSTLSIDEKFANFRKKACYVFRFTTRSSDFVSTFYEVSSSVTTLIEKETLHPLKFSKKSREGRHRSYQLMYFHPDEGYAAFYKRKGRKYVLRKEFNGIEGAVHNTLSVLIFLRTAPLREVGDKTTVKVCTGKRIVDVILEVKEEKHLTVEAGEFRALHISASFKVGEKVAKRLGKEEGLFVSEEFGEIWFDAVSRRPLLMTVDVPIGSARVELTKFSFPPPPEPAEETEEEKESEPKEGGEETEKKTEEVNDGEKDTERDTEEDRGGGECK